jgi:hypothetical protein
VLPKCIQVLSQLLDGSGGKTPAFGIEQVGRTRRNVILSSMPQLAPIVQFPPLT